MYESGGDVHWTGHLAALLVLMFVSAGATIFGWHENWLALPFFIYLGFLVLKVGRHGLQSVRHLLK